MKNLTNKSRAVLTVVHGCLIATLQRDLSDNTLSEIRDSILGYVHTRSVQGLLFEMSAVSVLDSYMFSHILETARTAEMLGARVVFVGFQPGVASALVDMELDTEGMETLRNMEEGLSYLSRYTREERQ